MKRFATCLVLVLLSGTVRGEEPATEALAEVNAARARAGLPPYVYDPYLTLAAKRCAEFRARHLLEGHTANDFVALPPRISAQASGCAAWPAWMGWGSCATFDVQYRYAGAAWKMGVDGKRYMHAFYRR